MIATTPSLPELSNDSSENRNQVASASKPNRAFTYWKALTALGPGWAIRRTKLLLLNKSGVLERRTPLHQWQDLSLANLLRPGVPASAQEYLLWRKEHSPAFLTDPLTITQARMSLGEGSVHSADGILQGDFPYFGYTKKLGFPPAWKPSSGSPQAAPMHWSRVNEFGLEDIKLWWEPSRFSWAFTLGRAYQRTHDERYPEAFWQLVQSWMQQNQPFEGMNWKCGQEAAIRTMALCFGLYVLSASPSSTAERVHGLLKLIAALALRIEAYLEYAISQKNNHGISEAMGLWTIGLLFPEFRHSTKWAEQGKLLLEREVRRQIYDDGSYVQHSLNYHRLMLQNLAWSIRLGERNSNLLSGELYERFAKSVRFLHALTDPDSGWAPNHGGNDGALVLPLSDCSYPDMRPVLQSCNFLSSQQRLYPPGPWDEEMIWLNGIQSANAPLPNGPNQPQELAAISGGYYTLHSSDSWALIRCANYRDRPAHADQLHVDLWWRGSNILLDPGTYSYNSPAPFDHGFSPTRYHNSVTIDGADQMTPVSRFLWADWADARVTSIARSENGSGRLIAEHDGYANRGVIHRRCLIRAGNNAWIVVDDLTGTGARQARLHWLMQDAPFIHKSSKVLELESAAGRIRITLNSNSASTFNLSRAGKTLLGEGSPVDPARGWVSRFYGCKEPALSIALEAHAAFPIRFVSIVQLGQMDPIDISDTLELLQVGKTSIRLSKAGSCPLAVETN